MTENEAIKILYTENRCLGKANSGRCKINCGDCKENIPIAYQEKAYEVAIAALKEVQEYREIGTVEECKEAVQKQKPRGCMLESKDNWTNYKCPACGQIKLSIYKRGNRFVRLKGITKYCENCGQALLDEDLQTPTGEQVE